MNLHQCPFCHVKQKTDSHPEPNIDVSKFGRGSYVVNCLVCDAYGPPGESKADAVQLWNNALIRVVRKPRGRIGAYMTKKRKADIKEAGRKAMLDKTPAEMAASTHTGEREQCNLK